jgi:GT2 family glycosyltransferase
MEPVIGKDKNSTAVLITCFNRKVRTVNCIKSLLSIDDRLDIYLVDDGSYDGTSDEIYFRFPNVNIIKGDGDLYWNRGMHLAWSNALKNNYDFFLWLNDDVLLYEFALDELRECSKLNNDCAIICGLVENAGSTKTIYGGFDRNKDLVEVNGFMNEINLMHGNVVLVPRFVCQSIGILDKFFKHDLGDIDYGLRAQKKGINIFSSRRAIAEGEINKICRVRLNQTTILKRFKRLYSPLGSPPVIDFYFRSRHKGISNALANFIFLHFINLIPDRINKILFKNKYT